MSHYRLSAPLTGTGTVTVQVPETNTDRTLTLPDESGTVLTSASSVVAQKGVPAFSAYQSSAQTVNAGTNTKITFTTEVFDTNSAYDTSTSRFQPLVAGYYLCTCGVRCDANPIAALHIRLAATGVEFAGGSFTNTSLGAFMSSCAGLVYLNGSTDFVECYTYSGTNTTLTTGQSATYFQGILMRTA